MARNNIEVEAITIFSTNASGDRQVAIPSQPLDPYLTNDDPTINWIINELLQRVLLHPEFAKRLTDFRGTTTRANFTNRIRRQLEIIALNVVEKHGSGNAIGVPRDKSYYVASKYDGDCGMSRELVLVIDVLADHGYVTVHIDNAQKFVSRIVPTPALIYALLGDDAEVRAREICSLNRTTKCGVVLKVPGRVRKIDKNGKVRFFSKHVRVPFKKLQTFDRYARREAEIRSLQDWFWTLQISYDGPDIRYGTDDGDHVQLRHGAIISSRIARHYRDTLVIPLRFYGNWQQVPSLNRQHLRINGLSTRELDFGSFFPTLLLERAGLNWKERFPLGDAYLLPRFLNDIEAADERMQARAFLKKVFVRYCFDTRHSADNVIRRFELDFYMHQECVEYGALDQTHMPVFHIFERMCKKPFREATEEIIREYCALFEGVPDTLMDWQRLQSEESRITDLVLDECMRRQIPCLPIHDGYVVPEIYAFAAKDMMARFSREVTGSSQFKIKQIE